MRNNLLFEGAGHDTTSTSSGVLYAIQAIREGLSAIVRLRNTVTTHAVIAAIENGWVDRIKSCFAPVPVLQISVRRIQVAKK